ncbi:hypothetical protein CTI12_AA454800 [Artemisia annua]|uniref:Homologous recombination OB-fold protein OB-fold domain-containing protein n=1 Tax=Artemisia annua TaxID=35608 RepID=A0A2U1LTZ8_ARTAN|nr:hypothetical protein CTI12_AA454800 [Artemisia annua]
MEVAPICLSGYWWNSGLTMAYHYYEDVQVRKGKSKADKKSWTAIEEVVLAKAWLHISTCQRVGNEQGRDKFWERIQEHFAATIVGTKRTHHSLNTKWKNMNRAMGIFNGLYIQQLYIPSIPFGCDIRGKENLHSSHSPKKPVRIIPGPAGNVELGKRCKQADTRKGGQECVILTQEYIRKVFEDVGEDEDVTCGSWLSVIEFMNVNGGGRVVFGCLSDIENFINNGKVDQVVAIIKLCTPNALGDLIITIKDLAGLISGAIHHKIINEGVYGKDITV